MTAEELWEKSSLTGEYTAWAFGDDADKLALLTKQGIKTATSSAYLWYESEKEPLPKVGEYSVILDARGNAVCVTRTTKVSLSRFCDVSAEHAFKEGEGDRTLAYWRAVHERFFKAELQAEGLLFDETLLLVLEEFEVVYS